MNQIQTTLLGVLAQALTGTEYEIPENTDWAALFTESKAQAVAPLVFSCISGKCNDEEVFRKWRSLTMRALQNNMHIQLQHDYLHRLMTAHEIPYCVIKGCSSAKDYPDPLLRAMGDVDFLVPDAFWDKAKKVLLEDGFVASGEDHDFHLEFHKKNINMEMHHEPFGLRGEKEQMLLEIVPELIDNSTMAHCDAASFRMPDAFGHGIVLLLHAYRHLVDTGIGVRHLCDWAVFVSGFSNQEFIHIFRERFQDLGIWKLAQAFGITAHRYLAIPYQDWMGSIDEDICRMLMLDIFNGGNFGKGSGDRDTQGKLLFVQEMEASPIQKVFKLLQNLNQTAIKYYPRAMRIPILRSFGWLILGFRYVFRILTGKRKKPSADTMKIVSMRKKLYQELAAFKAK